MEKTYYDQKHSDIQENIGKQESPNGKLSNRRNRLGIPPWLPNEYLYAYYSSMTGGCLSLSLPYGIIYVVSSGQRVKLICHKLHLSLFNLPINQPSCQIGWG